MEENDFIAKYCSIVDQCHGQRPDKLWFATWMSSKSPYFDFPRKFESFWETHNVPPAFKNWNFFLSYLKLARTLSSLIVKSLYVRLIFRKELAVLYASIKPYTLLRTFYYSPQNKHTDPFWGDLVSEDSASKEHFLIIYDPMFPIRLCKKAYDPQKNNFPYQAFLSIGSLVNNYIAIGIELLKNPTFDGDYSLNGITVLHFVRESYKREIIHPSTFASLAFYESFLTIFKLIKIKKALIPFENNPWEKMFYIAKKDAHANFSTIGYQHSTVQRGATNYFLSTYESKNNLVPDKIVTPGKYTKDLLSSYLHYQNIPVETGCALRYKYLEQYKTLKELSFNSIKALVILDGTEETYQLINLIDNFLTAYPIENNQAEFLFREHPNMPILSRKSPSRLIKLNVTKESLEANLQWANVIVYSGSTVALEALKIGIPVINFQVGKFSFDSLFELDKFKWNIKNHVDLFNAFSDLQSLDRKELYNQAKCAKRFIENYFFPCKEEHFEIFLGFENKD